ncbi:OmpA family protein [Photobacterium damselae]|uniref:OmpA family protein n=1 Tax=Photobacterium damselae TaxID=38293 RepID=UPI0040695256
MKVKLLLLSLLISNNAISETRHKVVSKQLINNSVVASIPFDFDSAKLSEKEIKSLKYVSYLIKKEPSIKIILTGNTDSIGDDKYNHQLGLERALSTAVFLENEFEISLENMVVRSRGERDPIASNQTSTGRNLNRRVDVYFPEYRYDIDIR